MRSPVASAVENARKQGVAISIYLDDFIGSHADINILAEAYSKILNSCVEANFVPNKQKIISPTDAIVAFNCDLTKNRTTVSEARAAKFLAGEHTPASKLAFEQYQARVASKNAT